MSLPDRFHEKYEVDATSGCWQWTAATTNGYGRVKWNGVLHLAHRLSYEHYVGDIPDGLELDHLCRNRGCINPAHLEPVTRRENILRGVSPPALGARVTYCPNGHPYDEANTYTRPGGGRTCRKCKSRSRLLSDRRRRARKAAR